jgi:hypothetical protein
MNEQQKQEKAWKTQALLMSSGVSITVLCLFIVGGKFVWSFAQEKISNSSINLEKVVRRLKPSGTKLQSHSNKYNWKFPKSACGDHNPPGEQNFYPVYVNKVDSKTLNHIKRNYCQDAYLLVRKESSNKSIQIASFAIKDKAMEFAQIMINDPNINSGEVGNPSLR